MNKNKTNKHTRNKGVILLEDLAPRKDVRGGSGRLLFGERVEDSEDERLAAERKREKKGQSP